MATSSFFPNPLSNDGADKLNYKWAMLLMLLLALVSFIIPLHPFYNNNNNNNNNNTPQPVSTSVQDLKPVVVPTYRAICWTPSQYTVAQIAYANVVCGISYNSAIRGEGDKTVYRVRMEDVIPFRQDDKPFVEAMDKGADGKQYIREDTRYASAADLKDRVTRLVCFQIPITFLMMAICLGLSQAVGTFVSECFGSINVGKTLEAMEAHIHSGSAGASSRQPVSEDCAEPLAQSIRRSHSTMSCLYLFKKILSVAFVLALIALLAAHVMPNVDEINDDFDKLSKPASQSGSRVNVAADNNNNNNNNSSSSTANPQKPAQDENEPFLCDLRIRQMQRVDMYTLQCLAVVLESGESHSDGDVQIQNSAQFLSRTPSPTVKNLLDLETTMVKIGMAVLVALLINNVLSLVAWAVKLMGTSSRTSLGLSDEASMDFLLLVQMSRINASAQVAHALARSSFGAKL